MLDVLRLVVLVGRGLVEMVEGRRVVVTGIMVLMVS